jgi:hypothetical protein
VPKAQEFIKEVAGGDEAIKAYGTYEEVYADKVSWLILSEISCNIEHRMWMRFTLVRILPLTSSKDTDLI